MRHYPLDHCDTGTCDRIIEALVPQTAERLLKQLVDGELADGKLAR
jgi:putative NIF3 family GTP cyclohydrolase 1 type 2